MATRAISAPRTLKPTSSGNLPPDGQSDLKVRLSRIEGHVRAVRTMIEEGESCDDILTQLAAIRAATTQVILKTFEGHMDSCVRGCVRAGKGDEALGALRQSLATVLRQV